MMFDLAIKLLQVVKRPGKFPEQPGGLMVHRG